MRACAFYAPDPCRPCTVTVALLFALTPTQDARCAALLDVDDEPIVHRLARQLLSHDLERVVIVALPKWAADVEAAVADLHVEVHGVGPDDLSKAVDEFGHSIDDHVVIGHADIVTHDGIITGLLFDPRVRSGILSAAGKVDGDPFRVFMQQGRVISAESPFHALATPTTNFLSLILVHRADLQFLHQATGELRALAGDGRPDGWDAELGRKIEMWGEEFTRGNAARYHLADQLDRLDPGSEWQPSGKPLRAEIDQAFHDTVIARGERVENDIVALTLVALTRTSITMRSAYRRELYWRRPNSIADAVTARKQLDTIDEQKELLDSSVKSDDGFFTTFFVSPYSKYIARWTARRGLTPNQVTSFSLLLAIAAAASFAVGETLWNVVGAILLQISFTFDCVDGQLARYSRQFSTMGAWLDSVFDRAKEGFVFAGLAFGALAADDNVWGLALAALAFQAVRHYLDFSWAALQHVEIASVELAPLATPQDTPRAPKARVWPPVDATDAAPAAAVIMPDRLAPSGLARVRRGVLRRGVRAASAASGLLQMSKGSRVAHWLKKMVVLPIGERLALISVTAIIGGPRLVFQALIIWGAVATMYMLAGRVLRSV